MAFSTVVLNFPFLIVFPSIAIYPLLRPISWNLTTQCLAVTGGCSVGECDRLNQPAGFRAHYNTPTLTYWLTSTKHFSKGQSASARLLPPNSKATVRFAWSREVKCDARKFAKRSYDDPCSSHFAPALYLDFLTKGGWSQCQGVADKTPFANLPLYAVVGLRTTFYTLWLTFTGIRALPKTQFNNVNSFIVNCFLSNNPLQLQLSLLLLCIYNTSTIV